MDLSVPACVSLADPARARARGSHPTSARYGELDALEAASVHLLREVAARCPNVALLFSGGADCAVVLRLAEKAFFPQRLPFPLLHVDTGHDLPEVIAFRDRVAREHGHRRVVRQVHPSPDPQASPTLHDAIAGLALDACIGSARRDGAHAGEPGEHSLVLPIADWTELDVWRYIAREGIELPAICFAHPRDVVRRAGAFVAVTPLTPAHEGERIERLAVRFCSAGDAVRMTPVTSTADTVEAIVRETAAMRVPERGTTGLRSLQHVHPVRTLGDAGDDGFRLAVQRVVRAPRGQSADAQYVDEDFVGWQGTVDCGIVDVGDAIVALPSGRAARVASLWLLDRPVERAVAGQAITLTLDREIGVSRGDVLCSPLAIDASTRVDALRFEPYAASRLDDASQVIDEASRRTVGAGLVA